MSRRHAYIVEVDRHIGRRIHSYRIGLGVSRQQLADEIGVTHQQLQKYEKGTNRISAGRLVLIAKALGKGVSAFYEGLDNSYSSQVLNSQQRMCLEVSKNFMQLDSPKYQNAINSLIKSLVKESA